MYFVTTKRAPYVLFCLTPSERFAVGLLEDGTVHLLATDSQGPSLSQGGGKILHSWDGARYSHTELMAALRYRAEPATAEELLGLLPSDVR
jgi:hypothetical protein